MLMSCLYLISIITFLFLSPNSRTSCRQTRLGKRHDALDSRLMQVAKLPVALNSAGAVAEHL